MNTMEQVRTVGAAQGSQQSPLDWAELAAAAVTLGQVKNTDDADGSFWVLSAEDAIAARRIFWGGRVNTIGIRTTEAVPESKEDSTLRGSNDRCFTLSGEGGIRFQGWQIVDHPARAHCIFIEDGWMPQNP